VRARQLFDDPLNVDQSLMIPLDRDHFLDAEQGENNSLQTSVKKKEEERFRCVIPEPKSIAVIFFFFKPLLWF